MLSADKQDYIRGYFDQLGLKIDRLLKLYEDGFLDEAFTLCIIYIDRLASGYYGGGAGNNAKSFSRALKELGENPLFGMIHPGELIKRTKKNLPRAIPLMESIVRTSPNALISEPDIAQAQQASNLPQQDKNKAMEHLWRASIANMCYENIRIPEVHGSGSGGFALDQTIYLGVKGLRIDFTKIYPALRKIFGHVKGVSIETGEWFGRKNYISELLERYSG
jgi:hypothetical protein